MIGVETSTYVVLPVFLGFLRCACWEQHRGPCRGYTGPQWLCMFVHMLNCVSALPLFLCTPLSVFVCALPDLCYSPSIVKEVLSKIPTHWWVLMRCIPRD